MKHNYLSIYVIAAGILMPCGCAVESPEAPRGGRVDVTASIGNDTRVVLSADDETLNLISRWEYDDEYVVPFLNNGRYTKVRRTKVTDLSEDCKTASFYYELDDDFFIPDNGYQFLCFTENCNAMIIDDEIYYDASLQREILSRYHAPMFAEKHNVDSRSNIGVNFGHYMTYEILHLKNTSREQITFSLNGFQSPDGIWYKTRGAICHRTGEFKTRSEASEEPVIKSPTYYFPAGYDDAFVSAYIPIEGQKISNATLVAEIDGNVVTSSNTKSSKVELKTGHAYHMYVVWNGRELKFVDGFDEPEPEPVPEYVDLGLPSGNLWATCNLGASRPEEYGLYYQWGDTQGYGSDTSDGKYFLWSDKAGNVSYLWCNGDVDNLTKYNTDPAFGIVDNKTVLEMEDDAARAALGGKWRMPTDEDWRELRQYCSCDGTSDYNGTGVAGMIFRSNRAGYKDKSIFLPSAGMRWYDYSHNVGAGGWYWSSSLGSDGPRYATYTYVGNGSYDMLRSFGLTVRPVYSETDLTSVSVTPDNLDFGDVKIGTNASASFTITNTGTAAANVSVSRPDDPVKSSFNGIVALAAGESKTITITCSPTETGAFEGAIGVTAGCRHQITYKGNAIDDKEEESDEYVDLGLSVKWATCNLGASKPEEYGLYYQWGDIQGHTASDGKYFGWQDDYGRVAYKWCRGFQETLTKYNNNSSYGTVDNKTVLEMEDDPARKALGGTWRTPTYDEWMELRRNCTFSTTNDYNGTGVAGRILTSKVPGYTGKSIFLPMAGMRGFNNIFEVGKSCYYWTASVDKDYPYGAWVYTYGYDGGGMLSYQRCAGMSIRPVLE